jgi:hypothetical protein
MAMTGMRVITTELGLVEQTPPQAVSRQRARALLRRAATRTKGPVSSLDHPATLLARRLERCHAAGGAVVGRGRSTGWWSG